MISDIWSCGIILYAISTGRLPFDENDSFSTLESIKKGKYEFPKGINMDDDLKDLINKMLEYDPKNRIKIYDIKKHSWYEKMLKYFKNDEFKEENQKDEINQEEEINQKEEKEKEEEKLNENNIEIEIIEYISKNILKEEKSKIISKIINNSE
jgi:serine/threonine protein kinase